VQQAPDDRVGRPLDDLQHAPFGPALSVLAHDPHTDLVLVQDRPHFVRRKVNISAAVVTDQESMPVAMSLNRAFNFIQQTAGGVNIFDI